jgi:hypothetical protein
MPSIIGYRCKNDADGIDDGFEAREAIHPPTHLGKGFHGNGLISLDGSRGFFTKFVRYMTQLQSEAVRLLKTFR